jgi:predicted nucleic acid-binding protein
MVDSNVALIATGQIGEAWAVVILEEIARGRFVGISDVFFLQEVLDRFFLLGENYKGKKLCKAFRKIMNKNLGATVQDFDLSYELFLKTKSASPRDLIHAAIMKHANILDIFSIDGPNFDIIKDIHTIHLPELLKSLELQGHYINERLNK